uniref:G-protein coupled receptors family 1 profile domain-containing protein n=1 Tax=Ditylenchus dipsaci TaxID=166011 RepID=A0A915EPB3_9BILA
MSIEEEDSWFGWLRPAPPICTPSSAPRITNPPAPLLAAAAMEEERTISSNISGLLEPLWPDQLTCVDIKEYLWQTQSDLTSLPSIMSVFAVIYSLIITLGVLGNSLVILSVMRHKSLQSVRNMFIVSLSCSDIVVSVVSGTITPIMAFTKVWLIGAPLCKLVPVIQGASLCFSTLTLTAIAIDRFILIIYPTKRSIQKRHACRMIVLNCVIAYSISAPMFFKQELVNFDQFCGRFCYEDWSDNPAGRSTYGTLVFVLQFVIPFFVITFCYLMISVKLSKGMMVKREGSSYSTAVGAAQSCPKTTFADQSDVDGHGWRFSVLLDPSVVFNFLRDYDWLPSFIVTQAYLYGVITHCISMSSTVWNPVLYALLNEHFRLAFVELFHRLRHRWLHLTSGEDSGGEHSYMASNQHLNNRAHRCSRLVSNAFLLDTTCPVTASNSHSKGLNGAVRSENNDPTTTAFMATNQNGVKGVLLGATTSLSTSSSSNGAVGAAMPMGEPSHTSLLLITRNSSDSGMAVEKVMVERQRLEEDDEIGCSENDDEV